MLASARGTFQKVPGMHGFLLGDFILSYHKQETILCPVYPHYGNLNKNRRTGTQKPATASPRNMKRHPKGLFGTFSGGQLPLCRSICLLDALWKPYIP